MQENPSLTVPLVLLLTSSADQLGAALSPAKAVLLAMFLLHYLNRRSPPPPISRPPAPNRRFTRPTLRTAAACAPLALW